MNADQNRSALPSGYQLHWYSIERVLGHGGFGTTYLARDTNLNQQVAIKEYFPTDIAIRSGDLSVQPKTNADADQYKWGLDRFRSEAQILARFDHPNIIRIFTVFEANHTAYLIMRYEKGKALNDILEQRKRLPQEELLGIVLPILDGLGKVHETGFIHRDIQPANIYIREDKSPVLIDFGAAREALGKPRTVTILVAPGYAPYEQYIANNQEQGPWTDIYGLGATLYRAVAGVAPIDAIERSRGILGSTRDVLVPATVVGQGRYTEAFLKAIDHALMFNEKDRPQTAMEWAQELRSETRQAQEAAIAGKPVAATPIIKDSNAAHQSAAAGDKVKRETKALNAGTLIRWGAPVLLFLIGLAAGILLLREDNTADRTPEVTTVKSPISVQPAGNSSVPEQKTSLNTALEAEARPAENRDGGSAVVATDSNRQLMDKITDLENRINASEKETQRIPAANDETARKQSEQLKQKIASDSDTLAAMEQELSTLKAQRVAEQKRLQDVIEERLRAQQTTKKQATEAKLPQKTEVSETQTSMKKTTGQNQVKAVAAPAEIDSMEPALVAYKRKDYKTAFTLFKPMAEQGRPEAQYYLATMYRNGQGILANNKSALYWIRKASWHGYGTAQIALAKMYSEGVDGNTDYFLAYTWYLMAERNGINSHVSERVTAERELQLEQLPQSLALVNYLFKRQGDEDFDITRSR
jgi:serine/threonine protein kinase